MNFEQPKPDSKKYSDLIFIYVQYADMINQ